MSIDDVKIIQLPKFLDERGNLSFVENNNQIPFSIKRTYWVYDVPGGVTRGGHAEKQNEELVIAMSGSFSILIDDGKVSKTFILNRSYYGLYIPKGLWREIKDFSTNALALEFGSIAYDVNDYIRDYQEFLEYTKLPNQEQIVTKDEPKSILANSCMQSKFSVFDCTMVELDKHHSNRNGNLTVVENGSTLPFDVKRVYYLYDVPGGESRGSHAHRELDQFIVAASGSFRVILDDGSCRRSFYLSRPYQGLYVRRGMWRDLEDFSSGAVCMVLASDVYKASDYIRDYQEFKEFRKGL